MSCNFFLLVSTFLASSSNARTSSSSVLMAVRHSFNRDMSTFPIASCTILSLARLVAGSTSRVFSSSSMFIIARSYCTEFLYTSSVLLFSTRVETSPSCILQIHKVHRSSHFAKSKLSCFPSFILPNCCFALWSTRSQLCFPFSMSVTNLFEVSSIFR